MGRSLVPARPLALLASLTASLSSGALAQQATPVDASAVREGAPRSAVVERGRFEVSYQNGELRIEASDAPLLDVLRQACDRIDAALDVTSEAEVRARTSAVLGPERPREVLAALLGDSLDYAMVGRADRPDEIGRLILYPKAQSPLPTSTPSQDGEAMKGDNEGPAMAGELDAAGVAAARGAGAPQAASAASDATTAAGNGPPGAAGAAAAGSARAPTGADRPPMVRHRHFRPRR